MNIIVTQLLTGPDGKTHDIARWCAACGFLNGIGLSIYDVVWHSTHFDIQSYGLGFGLLITGVGAAIKFKEDSEPKGNP
jgi:hypothetical protein